jgi:FlgN protein
LTFEKYTENLEKLMKKELALINHFSGIEEKIKDILVTKDWTLLEIKIREMNTLAERISDTEEKRNDAYQAMKLYCRDDEVKSFYLFVSMFCPDKKEILIPLYRELKVGVLKVKNITARIDTYVNSVVSTVEKVLDEVYPSRKGTIYDMSGTKSSGLHQPMILDREL